MAENVIQNICVEGSYSDDPWRYDGVLATPLPFYPRDGANICLEPSISNPSQIDIIWLPVAGALQYILEWCSNDSFSGPTLRATITGSTQYALQKDVDIRIGDTLYWRVFARDGFGLVSDKSVPRTIKYECPDNAIEQPNTGADRCQNYDVKLQIHGADYMKCCESSMWSIELSYACGDQLGNPLLTVDSIEWSISVDPEGDHPPEIEEEADDFVIVRACGIDRADSQIFEVSVTVTFNDILAGDTFECTATRKVFLDCHAGIKDQPWAESLQDYTFLEIPDDYYSPIAYSYLRTCGDFVYPEYPLDCMVLVGPVFKVPVDDYYSYGCRDGIELECCPCFPTAVPFLLQTTKGTTSGNLRWDGQRHIFIGEKTSITGICQTVTLTATLECSGGDFVFNAEEVCLTPCEGEICDGRGVDDDTLVLTYNAINCDTLAGIASGVIDLHQGPTDGTWVSDNVEMCDNGCIYTVAIDLSGATPKIYVRMLCVVDGELTDEDVNPSGNFDTTDCGETLFTGEVEIDDDTDGSECCITLTLTAQLCEPGESRSLTTDPFSFENCTAPSASMDTDWLDEEDDPVLAVTVNLGGGIPGMADCPCVSYGYYNLFYGERRGLEARVNLPIGCGLKIENGVLVLDLDAIAGHGLKVGEDETGCPYLWVDWREGTEYCCDYGCYCCDYDDLFICANGEQILSFGDGEFHEGIGPESGGMDGGSP